LTSLAAALCFVRLSLLEMSAEFQHHLPPLQRTADFNADIEDLGKGSLVGIDFLQFVPGFHVHAQTKIAGGCVEVLEDRYEVGWWEGWHKVTVV
jgi:hypothetical protein